MWEGCVSVYVCVCVCVCVCVWPCVCVGGVCQCVCECVSLHCNWMSGEWSLRGSNDCECQCCTAGKSRRQGEDKSRERLIETGIEFRCRRQLSHWSE